MPRPPKHPSVRARRNDPRKDFRTLRSATREGKPVPPWPLSPSPRATATLELSRDRVAALQVELEDATDGRTKGRLRAALAKAEMLVAVTEIQVAQAADAEVALWSQLWAMPQADIWEESHALREVAQYVRWKIAAEQGDLKASTEARMLSDRLGLNPLALLKLRAEIEHLDEAEARGEQRRQTARPLPTEDEDDDPRGGLYAVN